MAFAVFSPLPPLHSGVLPGGMHSGDAEVGFAPIGLVDILPTLNGRDSLCRGCMSAAETEPQ
jgi:hypothetical protein